MSVTQVSNDNILSMSAAKLTGAMPAIDGSALTGIVAGSEAMTGASDPANETNPADGVGALYINTTTGEMFICTDATTDANEWANVGEGSGDITPPYIFQGTSDGWIGGGNNASSVIETHSFTSDSNGVASGSTLEHVYEGVSASKSKTHLYFVAGYGGGLSSKIQKVSFTSAGQSNDIGNISTTKYCAGGASSELRGYSIGGLDWKQDITYVSHSTDGQSSNVGNLYDNERGYATSMSGPTEALTEIGWYNYNYVHHFSFANDSSCTKHCDMVTGSAYGQMGTSSVTHGYTMSAHQWHTGVRKVGFATGSTQSTPSTLSVSGDMKHGGIGTCSQTHGYACGGYPLTGSTKYIEKWNFSTEASVSHIADLSEKRAWPGGAQI